MIVLAIDTCLARCAACLYDVANQRILAQEQIAMERGHAEALPPMVKRLLSTSGINVSQIGRIAVTVGPGTFTGLRIGLSFARAFGLARGIPVIGLDTLHAQLLSQPQPTALALTAGQSHLAYLLRAEADIIELIEKSKLPDCKLDSEMPDLALLAVFAAKQPSTDKMPVPVYIRAPDAKPQITIRELDDQNRHILVKLHQAAFDTTISPANVYNAAETHLLAEIAGEPVAFISYQQILDEVEIISLGTTPRHRRLGAAGKLLLATLQKSKISKVKKIFLEVAHTNIAAQSIYLKHGFVEFARRKTYYRNGDDAILMSQELK